MRTRAGANRSRNRSSAKVEVSGKVDARELGARRDPELEVHVGQVVADGAGADQQLCRDLPIRQPTGGKPGDTQLLGGQAGRVFVAARIAGQVELALRPGMQKSRTDAAERAGGGNELLDGVRSPTRPPALRSATLALAYEDRSTFAPPSPTPPTSSAEWKRS